MKNNHTKETQSNYLVCPVHAKLQLPSIPTFGISKFETPKTRDKFFYTLYYIKHSSKTNEDNQPSFDRTGQKCTFLKFLYIIQPRNLITELLVLERVYYNKPGVSLSNSCNFVFVPLSDLCFQEKAPKEKDVDQNIIV